MNERPSPGNPMTMDILVSQCCRFFDSNQGFHLFSSAFSFLSVCRATEGRRNRVNLLLYATLIWIRSCIVCYRKEHTLWSQRHFHIERQPARKSSPYNGVVVLPTTTVYRNLIEFQQLPHLQRCVPLLHNACLLDIMFHGI